MIATMIVVVACLFASTGCHETWRYDVLSNVSVSLPEITGRERSRERAGSPSEYLEIFTGGEQTLLVVSHVKDDPNVFDDEWSRTFVIVLDGPLATGTFEVTPDNGRLIEASAWLPPRQPYAGLEGTIKIVQIKKNGDVWIDGAVRNVIAQTGDPVWTIRGWRTFKPYTGGMLHGVRVVQTAGE